MHKKVVPFERKQIDKNKQNEKTNELYHLANILNHLNESYLLFATTKEFLQEWQENILMNSDSSWLEQAEIIDFIVQCKNYIEIKIKFFEELKKVQKDNASVYDTLNEGVQTLLELLITHPLIIERPEFLLTVKNYDLSFADLFDHQQLIIHFNDIYGGFYANSFSSCFMLLKLIAMKISKQVKNNDRKYLKIILEEIDIILKSAKRIETTAYAIKKEGKYHLDKIIQFNG